MVEFKTSFIPKRPIVALSQSTRSSLPANLLFSGSLIIFLLLLVIAGGLYFYKVALTQKITTMSDSLDRAREAIDPAFVENLKRLDNRLAVARTLLDSHTIVSPLFAVLQSVTLQSVQFDQFSFTTSDKGESQIILSGKARDYASLALQSDAMGNNADIKEPVFSNLRLDNEGKVLFSLTAGIRKDLLSWKGEKVLPPQVLPQTNQQ